MAHIDVQIRRPDASEIRYDLSPSPRARKYLTETTYRIDYPVDISGVDRGILAVPVLTNLAPVAWATGTTVRIDTVDEMFWSCLDDLKAGYRRLYPDVDFNGSCVADQLAAADGETTEKSRSATLFSGGVDSVSTYLRHTSDSESGPPALLTIRKANDGDRWEYMQSNIETFVETAATDCHFIKTNLRGVLDEHVLNVEYQAALGRNWWGAVQFGPAYMGICAPLMAALGYETLYQSSGFTADPHYPVSAQPYIVDAIEWSGTACQLDAPDLTRQQKIDIIAENIGPYSHDVFSCTSGEDGGNCVDCETCYRTLLGFLAAGVDPNRVGYDVADDDLNRIRTAFETGELTVNATKIRIYRDIQDAMEQADLPFGDEFASWFTAVDLERFRDDGDETSLKRSLWRRLPYPADALSMRVWRSVR